MNKSKISVQRKKHNEDLINRMKQGESLQNQTAADSWFPPRPVIKKDSAALKELYLPSEVNEEKVLSSSVEKTPKKVRHLKLA